MTSNALLVPLAVLALLMEACLSVEPRPGPRPVRSMYCELLLDDARDIDWQSIETRSYTSKSTRLRGLAVRSLPDALAEMLAIERGDVLLFVGKRPCLDRATCEQLVRDGIEGGVWRIATRWVSNGQVVDRIYVRAVGG